VRSGAALLVELLVVATGLTGRLGVGLELVRALLETLRGVGPVLRRSLREHMMLAGTASVTIGTVDSADISATLATVNLRFC